MKKDTIVAIRDEDGGLRFVGPFDRVHAKLWVSKHEDWLRSHVIGIIERPEDVSGELMPDNK